MPIKLEKKPIVASSILLICMLVAYLGYEFLIPELTLSPRPSEKRKLRKELYNIEQITVMKKDMDISEFRKLIPDVKITSFLLMKNQKDIGVARFKNGNKLQITNNGTDSYCCISEGSNMLFYYFEGNAGEKWMELVNKTVGSD